MRMPYIIDTYAWIEYFRGTEKGRKVSKLLEKNDTFITAECCVFELKCWALSDNLDFSRILQVVKSISRIYPIWFDDWTNAAEIRNHCRKTIKDFGLVDSLLVAMQRKHNAKVVSGDKHFKTLDNVYYIGD